MLVRNACCRQLATGQESPELNSLLLASTFSAQMQRRFGSKVCAAQLSCIRPASEPSVRTGECLLNSTTPLQGKVDQPELWPRWPCISYHLSSVFVPGCLNAQLSAIWTSQVGTGLLHCLTAANLQLARTFRTAYVPFLT